jgi:hypothetical protein
MNAKLTKTTTNRIMIIMLTVCIALSLIGGCSHSLIQEDGQDRHLAKVQLNKDGFLLSLFGGTTSTRVTTKETEEKITNSKKPTAIHAGILEKLINDGHGERVAKSLEM